MGVRSTHFHFYGILEVTEISHRDRNLPRSWGWHRERPGVSGLVAVTRMQVCQNSFNSPSRVGTLCCT